jgi:hypothetical protein
MAGSVVAQELEILGKFIKSLGDGERTDAGYDGEINIYWDTVNLVVRMQVYSATKPGWEAFDPTGYSHASRHSVGGGDTITMENLATAGALGTAPVSDGVGAVAMLDIVSQTELTAHAASNHVTNGDTHNHAGGDGAQVDHGGLAGLADDDHTNYLTVARHDGDDHSGLAASELPAHALRHSDEGGDEITVENLATSGASGTVLTSDGAGGLTMEVSDVGVSIKSRQAGTISISSSNTTGTATITAVTIANCQVSFQGTSGLFAVDVAAAATPTNPTDVPMTGRVALTATTTVTATRGAPYTYGGGATTTVTGYEVLEWQ